MYRDRRPLGRLDMCGLDERGLGHARCGEPGLPGELADGPGPALRRRLERHRRGLGCHVVRGPGSVCSIRARNSSGGLGRGLAWIPSVLTPQAT